MDIACDADLVKLATSLTTLPVRIDYLVNVSSLNIIVILFRCIIEIFGIGWNCWSFYSVLLLFVYRCVFLLLIHQHFQLPLKLEP